MLNALGAVVMDRQNAVFQSWFESHAPVENPEALLDDVYQLLKMTYDVTREQVGGAEIIQALRAVAPLQDLRLTSHRLVATQFAEILSELIDRPLDEVLLMQARLTVDTGYAIVEMALEDDSLSTENTLRQGAHMVGLYWRDVLSQQDA